MKSKSLFKSPAGDSFSERTSQITVQKHSFINSCFTYYEGNIVWFSLDCSGQIASLVAKEAANKRQPLNEPLRSCTQPPRMMM